MAEETEKPKRRRRKKAEDASTSEAQRASGADEGTSASDTSASDADASTTSGDEVQPTAAAEEAADEAADVIEEAEAEVEADTELQKPRRAPRRRRRAAQAEEDASESEAVAPEADAEPSDTERARAEEPDASSEATRPAPTRRRARRDPNLPPPEVRAQAKYVRSSARKARLVCDHIRGKSVDEARAILALTPRAAARDWSKLLESAVANAENNHELVGEDLYVKVVRADEGPTLKRFRPRAMGRATQIRKRTSHLTILLTPKE